MKITRIGVDYIEVNEDFFIKNNLAMLPKIHLVKLNFKDPTREKIEDALKFFKNTNRFIISNNIKIYNEVFKSVFKKYYVENQTGQGLVSFFRKNNKVLLNFNNINEIEFNFLIYSLSDVLKNVEVIRISKKIFDKYIKYFENWDGNCIVE